MLRTFVSWARTCCGVNPLLTSLRRCQCTGSSCSIIMPVGPLSGRMPPALDHTSGCFEISLTSSYFVMPQTPVVSFQCTGSCSRSHVNAVCGSAPQKSPLTKSRSGVSPIEPLFHDFGGVFTQRRRAAAPRRASLECVHDDGRNAGRDQGVDDRVARVAAHPRRRITTGEVVEAAELRAGRR